MIKKLNQSSLFEELYCLLLLVIGFTCYCLSPITGMIIIISLASLSLLILNDFKYVIPSILFFIFSNSNTVTTYDFPIPFFISAIVFVIVLIFFMIKNKPDFSKLKSGKGIFLLGIVSVLPIFWHNIITKGNEFLYFLYLSYLFFFVLYVIFATSLKKNTFTMLTKSMGYIGILIALESIYHISKLHIANPEANILTFAFHAGWGICNEAGIMMCVCLPFMFIRACKGDELIKVIIEIVKISVVAAGMFLTNSRGTYLFGGIEIFLLFIWTMIRGKKRWTILLSTIVCLVISYYIIELVLGFDVFIQSIKDVVFAKDFSDNGRYALWRMSYDVWSQDFVRMTFGSGMVAEYYADNSRYIVYHSTFFQTLATVGNLGVAFLIIHFVEKYRQIKKFDLTSAVLMSIGFISVDLYGMIDNTYGMYYYMIPLMIMMATIDNMKIREEKSLL